MSTFTSLCHNKAHNDKIDVAYSFVTDEVRLIIWKDDDGFGATALLSVDEATHVIALMSEAIERIVKQ